MIQQCLEIKTGYEHCRFVSMVRYADKPTAEVNIEITSPLETRVANMKLQPTEGTSSTEESEQ